MLSPTPVFDIDRNDRIEVHPSEMTLAPHENRQERNHGKVQKCHSVQTAQVHIFSF